MKTWVSTVSIFIGHLQTIAILSNLRLQWPPSVREISSIFSLSLVGQSMLRPECFVSSDVNLYFILALCEVSIILVILGSLTAAAYSHKLSGKRVDSLWLIISVLIGVLFATSWKLCLALFRLAGTESEDKWSASAAVAAVLVLLMILVLWKLFRSALAILRHMKVDPNPHRSGQGAPEHGQSRAAPSGSSAPAGSGIASLADTSQSARARTLTSLGAPRVEGGVHLPPPPEDDDDIDDAPSVAVISPPPSPPGSSAAGKRIPHRFSARGMGRVSAVGEPWERIDPDRLHRRLLYITGRYATHAPYWQFVIWARQLTLILISVFTRLAVESDNITDDSLAQRGVVWVQAVLALLVLGGAWRVHSIVRPYEFAIQNRIEHFLYATNVVIVTLGTVYTGLTLAPLSSGVRALVEAAMIITLVGSLLCSLTYLAHSHRRGTLKVTQAEAEAKEAAERVDKATAQTRWLEMQTMSFKRLHGPELQVESVSAEHATVNVGETPSVPSPGAKDGKVVRRGGARGRHLLHHHGHAHSDDGAGSSSEGHNRLLFTRL